LRLIANKSDTPQISRNYNTL